MDPKKADTKRTVAEFLVLKLEDRLEFAELCDDNCGCTPGGTNGSCSPTPPVTNIYCPR